MNKTFRYSGIALIIIGIIGAGYLNYSQTQGVNLARAEQISDRYLDSLQTNDLEINEIMEFEYNYYIVYIEHETGIGAFEMLIDKKTGRIFPEYGPNMMWNLKYGHGGMMGRRGIMGGYYLSGSERDVITEEESLEIAQNYLDEIYPGSDADDPHLFYGYYTIHSVKNGRIFGMLSVNTLTEAVWYHNWHGEYIQSIENH